MFVFVYPERSRRVAFSNASRLRSMLLTPLRLRSGSIFQNIPYKIMILGKRGQVIMSSSNDPDQRDLVGIDLLQFFTMPDGDQPVFGAVNDVRMAIHMADPFIGAQVIS